MIEENIGQEPNFKNVDETRNCLVEEIKTIMNWCVKKQKGLYDSKLHETLC